MTTPFNCVSHRASLEKLRNYTATAAFISDIGWKAEGFGHVLCNKATREETVCIAVGKVSSARLYTGPTGGHSKQFTTPFHKAKFQFTLTTPDEPALMHDFQASVAALAKAQEAISSTENCAYMILQEGAERSIRFSANVFTKRDKEIVLQPSPSPPEGSTSETLASSDDDEDTIDEETEKWPVPTDYLDDLEAIKTTYMATPLKVYMGNQFIEPLDVTKTLDGALVEVHFTVQQYRITQRNPITHSFSAMVEQVLILKRAKAKSSPYKRKDYRRGPISMPESPTKRRQPTPSSSGQEKDQNAKGDQNPVDGVKIMVPGNGLGLADVNRAPVTLHSENNPDVANDPEVARSDQETEKEPPTAPPAPAVSGTEGDAQEETIGNTTSEENNGPAKKPDNDQSAQHTDDNEGNSSTTKELKGKQKASESVDEPESGENSAGGATVRPKRGGTRTKALAGYRNGPADNWA